MRCPARVGQARLDVIGPWKARKELSNAQLKSVTTVLITYAEMYLILSAGNCQSAEEPHVVPKHIFRRTLGAECPFEGQMSAGLARTL